jgi:hypothetical protein
MSYSPTVKKQCLINYGANLLSLVARQLHLSAKQFNDLIDCPLTYEEYLTILKTKNFLVV